MIRDKVFTFKVTVDEYKAFKRYCTLNNTTVTEVLRDYILTLIKK